MNRLLAAKLRPLLLIALAALPLFAHAQVNLPNGGLSEKAVDLRVQTVSGLVTVDRQHEEGRWRINLRWDPAVLAGEPVGGSGCREYPELKVRGMTYTGDGQTWLKENRYSAKTTAYFDGAECPANRIKTIHWQDRNTGNWMDYQRSSPSELGFKLVKYGDRNNVVTQLTYDAQGKLQSVLDHTGNVVLQYGYTGDLLTEIRDNPGLIPGNTAPARIVKYAYGNITDGQGNTTAVINQVTDVLGNITRYGMTGANITSITDAEARVRRYAYTANRVTQYTDADGKITTYVYDYDKLKKEFYVRATYPETAAGKRIVETWYDTDGRIVRRDINGRTDYRKGALDTATRSETRTDAAGRQTVLTQDEYGNVVKTVYPDGSSTSAKYSALHGQVTEETDELGVRTTYDYDSRGNRIRKTEAVGLPEQRITEYQVNELGQVTQETRKGKSGATGIAGQDLTFGYGYDALGNRNQITYPLGQQTRYEHDLMGNPVRMTDALGRTWQAEFDAAGHLVARTNPLGQRSVFAYDKVGNGTQYTDALNNATRYTVDGQNRITQQTDPLGGIRKTEYDPEGRILAEINEAGQTTARFAYDIEGRLTRILDAGGNPTDYEYDTAQSAFGPARIKRGDLSRELKFDLRNRPVELIDTWQTTDGNGATQTATTRSKRNYDGKGQLAEAIDRLGNKTQRSYDGLGRLVRAVDALGGIYRFDYDTRNNLIAFTDARGNITRFEYDANGRKTKEIRPLGQATTYTYDAVGQLTEVVDAQGNKQRYSYDTAGRGIKEETLDTSGAVVRTIDYTYNAAGTLIGVKDRNSGHADHLTLDSAITVDALQRKTRDDITLGGRTVSLVTTYSATGKKASQSLADGTVIRYRYDQAGGEGGKGTDELAGIEIPGAGTLSIGARNWGQPSQVTYPGGSQRQNDYDALQRLTGIHLKDPGQQNLMNWQYQFDAESNITQRQTEHGDYAYTYDSLNRLTQVSPDIANGPGLPAETYTYDSVGNRLTDNNRGGSSVWQYNANNQLTRSYNGDSQTVDLQYDANGSLTQRSTSASDPYNQQRYQYDAKNRLTEIQDSAGNKIASYQYDPYGRRIRKTEYRELNAGAWAELATPRTTTYYYSDEGLAAECLSTGDCQVQYGWEPGSYWATSPLFMKAKRTAQSAAEYFYYQNDHLGTPQSLIDAQGSLVWNQRSEAFGKATIAVETVSNNLRFPGQYYDHETNTHDNYFRNYDFNSGRYVQQDPIGLMGGDNLYGYALDSPTGYVDVMGLSSGLWIPTPWGPIPLFFPPPTPSTNKPKGDDYLFPGNTDNHGGPMPAPEPLEARGNSDPAKPPNVNPGRDGCKCRPCPPMDVPPWPHTGNAHGSTNGTHWHWYQYFQNPDTCECHVGRRSGPSRPS